MQNCNTKQAVRECTGRAPCKQERFETPSLFLPVFTAWHTTLRIKYHFFYMMSIVNAKNQVTIQGAHNLEQTNIVPVLGEFSQPVQRPPWAGLSDAHAEVKEGPQQRWLVKARMATHSTNLVRVAGHAWGVLVASQPLPCMRLRIAPVTCNK